MMRRDRSAAMGGVTAIELTTLKSYSSTIIFIHMRQYCYSRVDSDVSLDVLFLHALARVILLSATAERLTTTTCQPVRHLP